MAVCAVGAAVVALASGCTTTTRTFVVASPVPKTATSAAAPPGVLLNGVYKTLVGDIAAQWTIASKCATEGCTATVSSSNGGWTGNALLTGGRWNITVVRPDGFSCKSGATRPSTNTYSWDASSLTGTVDSTHDAAVCPGEPAGTFHDTFTIVTPPVSVASQS